jgi:hypothetical protein
MEIFSLKYVFLHFSRKYFINTPSERYNFFRRWLIDLAKMKLHYSSKSKFKFSKT